MVIYLKENEEFNMDVQLDPRIEDILEKWEVSWETYEQDGDYYTECEFYSDAGEDFVFDIWHDGTVKSFVDSFADYAFNFDPDEHAEMFMGMRGQRGVPQSIRVLISDADSIAETLDSIADELKAIR